MIGNQNISSNESSRVYRNGPSGGSVASNAPSTHGTYPGNAYHTHSVKPKDKTAAQVALHEVEVLRAELATLRERLASIAGNLGVGVQDAQDSTQIRPIRPGVIGSIHDQVENCHNVVNDILSLVSRIEGQV